MFYEFDTILVIDNEDEDTLEPEYIENKATINLECVDSFCGWTDKDKNLTRTMLYLKGGNYFVVNMPYPRVVALMKGVHKSLFHK